MVQCSGKTRTGAQCSRRATQGTRCYQHQLHSPTKTIVKLPRQRPLKKIDKKSLAHLKKVLAKKTPTAKREIDTFRASKAAARKLESPVYIAGIRRSRDNPFASKYLKSDRDSLAWTKAIFNRMRIK